MKTERRHELQKNQLADWLGQKLIWCEENARLLAGVVLSVVVVAGVLAYYNHSRTERLQSAWNGFFDATQSGDPTSRTKSLERLANNESAILPGQLSDLLLADIALNEGIEQLTTDREAGEKRLNEAKNRYVAARDAAADVHVKERATLGLARFYEAMGLLEDAAKEYRSLADIPGGLYKAQAERKLDYLAKPSVIAFAKEFRERKPPIKPVDMKLFDVDALNKMPQSEASFPGANASGAAVASTPAASATPSATPTASPSATPAAGPATKK